MRKIRTTAGKNRYKWEWNEFKFLVYVLSEANNFEENLNLFIDLHTTKEITEIIRRSIISSYILSGKTYEEISDMTGASSNTISNIAGKLHRKKEVLSKILDKTGNYDEFLAKTFDKKDLFNNIVFKARKRLNPFS
ncbi:MAG: Trp family transcriptional regulator [Candidatus Berkelbacteria bacterium]|nr:Trp family transcriptional regulator [Candidatus Berkelbacteria bacterium]